MINSEFLARMENILKLYRLPYDERYPLVCFDERPCFLIGDVVKGLGLSANQARKQHYEYEKNGSCCLLLAIEPLTGKRIAVVYDQRRKIEYAEFMEALAAHFPKAEKIRLVQDNLNTHYKKSFYDRFDAETAFRLAEKFEFHYTPKKASWLNAAEIEFSAIARTCLNKRIPTKKELESEVLECVKEREKNQIRIDWKFDVSTARKKMNRHYKKVNPENQKYKET